MIEVQKTMKSIYSLAFAVLMGTAFLYAESGKLSDTEFMKLAQTHDRAEAHQKLAAHYTAHAIEHEKDAKDHEELAKQYDKTEPRLAGEAHHYAAHSQEAAEALRNLAKIHQDLAKEHAVKAIK